MRKHPKDLTLKIQYPSPDKSKLFNYSQLYNPPIWMHTDGVRIYGANSDAINWVIAMGGWIIWGKKICLILNGNLGDLIRIILSINLILINSYIELPM